MCLCALVGAAFGAEYSLSADFEGGTIPAPFWSSTGVDATQGVATGSTARSGSSSLRQALQMTRNEGSGTMLGIDLPANASHYRLEGWLYVQSFSPGMCSSWFTLGLEGQGPIGVDIGSGTSSGYYGLCGLAPSLNGQSVPPQTWHHVVVEYDRAAGKADVTVDDRLILDDGAVPGGGLAGAVRAGITGQGGYVTGMGIAQYIDDVTVRVTMPEVQEAVRARVDILPGVRPNRVRAVRGTQIPVVVFGGGALDCAAVATDTVRLAGAAPVGTPRLSDVNGDGRQDLSLRFMASDLELGVGECVATLNGRTWFGRPFIATDRVRILAHAPWWRNR